VALVSARRRKAAGNGIKEAEETPPAPPKTSRQPNAKKQAYNQADDDEIYF
jgi:hypothetical protein